MKITRGNFLSFLGVLATAVGAITAFASLTTLNPMIAFTSLALIVIIGLVFGFIYFRQKESFSPGTIPFTDLPSVLTIRYILNEAELKRVADLDEECYGEHSVNFSGLLDWWNRYPEGIHGLFHSRKLVGAIGIWPLTKKAFVKLTSGNLMESQLCKDDIRSKPDKHIYWYFGDIILEKKYRRKLVSSYIPHYATQNKERAKESLTSYFLFHALEAWLKNGNVGDQVQISALGATPAGVNLLEHSGFHRSPHASLDKLPIYIRVATPQELLEDKNAIWGNANRQQISSSSSQ